MKTLFKTIVLLLLSLLFIHCKPEPIEPIHYIDYNPDICLDFDDTAGLKKTYIDLFEDNTTWTCVAVCPLGYFAFKHPTNTSYRKCVRMCHVISGVYYFADDVSRSCVTKCPMIKYSVYGDKINFKCVKNCSR